MTSSSLSLSHSLSLSSSSPKVEYKRTSHAPYDHTDLSARILRALQHVDFHKKRVEKTLVQDLMNINVEELELVLNEFFENIKIEADLNQLLKVISKLSSIIPLETLKLAIRKKYPNQGDALLTAKSMLQEARHFLDQTEAHKASPTIKSRISSIVDSFISLIESLLNIFGIEDFLKPPANDFDAQMKTGKVMMLASIFLMFTSTLLPLFGVEMGGLIVGGTMIGLALLSVIYPKIRPRARRLPSGINLTKEMEEGRYAPIGGRKNVVAQIAEVFKERSNKLSSHVMLLGESGVGKTQSVYAFTQAVAKGEIPHLKGMTFFYFNAADLAKSKDMITGQNLLFQKISDEMGKHRKKIGIILDEIHALGPLMDNIKKFLDAEYAHNFPYVIGLSTKLEFTRDIFAKNPALARRFKCIPIENMESEHTLGVLSNYLMQEAPKILVQRAVLRYLTEQTGAMENVVQPGQALKVLADCVKEVSDTQKLPLEIEIEKMKDHLELLRSQGAVDPLGMEIEYYTKITEAQRNLDRLESQLKTNKLALKKFSQFRDKLALIKKKNYQKIIKVGHAKKIKAQCENEILLMKFFGVPSIEKTIRAQAQALGTRVEIDKSLVDFILERHKANAADVQAIVASGRRETLARTIAAPVAAPISVPASISLGIPSPVI